MNVTPWAMCMKCRCNAVIWLVAHIMWVHNVHNSHFGVCLEGSIIHKKGLESPPRMGGEVKAVSCQSALIRRINRGFAT